MGWDDALRLLFSLDKTRVIACPHFRPTDQFSVGDISPIPPDNHNM